MKLHNFGHYMHIQFIPTKWYAKLFKPKFTLAFYSGYKLYLLKNVTNEVLEAATLPTCVLEIKTPPGWQLQATEQN